MHFLFCFKSIKQFTLEYETFFLFGIFKKSSTYKNVQIILIVVILAVYVIGLEVKNMFLHKPHKAKMYKSIRYMSLILKNSIVYFKIMLTKHKAQ